jgi:hypothetical protein
MYFKTTDGAIDMRLFLTASQSNKQLASKIAFFAVLDSSQNII